MNTVAQKEQEWRDALHEQILLLEDSVKQRENELVEERKQTAKLKEDFKYNLTLLHDRDVELEQSEKDRYLLQQKVSSFEVNTSNLSMKVDELQHKLKQENLENKKLVQKIENLLDEKSREIEFLKHDKELEVSRFKDESHSKQKQSEIQIIQLKSDKDNQKREILSACENRLRELKSECQNKVQSMEQKILEYELKQSMLEKELSSVDQNRRELLSQTDLLHSKIAKLEHTNKELQLRMDSDVSILTNEKERLHEFVACLKSDNSKQVERLQNKISDLEQEIVEKDAKMQTIRSSYKDERSALKSQLAELIEAMDKKETEFNKATVDYKVQLRSRDSTIEDLRDEVDNLKGQLKDYSSKNINTVTKKDVEIERLNSEVIRLKDELSGRLSDVEWYKHEMVDANRRISELENVRNQLEAEFRLKTEELQSLQYEKSETIIQSLTDDRNAALQKMKDLQNTLNQKQAFIQSLMRDRNMAMETLKSNGINIDKQVELSQEVAESENLAKLNDLQSQNDVLKGVIKNMRAEMEQMSQPQTTRLENDEAKSHNNNALTNRSIHELSVTIGKIRQEKTALLAQCRKAEARAQHLEAHYGDCKRECKAMESTCEQLRYDIASKERHHCTEISNMKRRIQDLESHLDETRREADEYFKANISNGKVVDQLQEELMIAKSRIEGSSSVHPNNNVNFGAQEMYIQQLQDEVQRLTDRLNSAANFSAEQTADDNLGNQRNKVLLSKLKLAAGQIKKLAQEKQVLVDLCNRLRAEQQQVKSRRTRAASAHGSRGVQLANASDSFSRNQPIFGADSSRMLIKDAVGDLNGKLAQLERIQYHITKDDLAQRQQNKRELASSPPVRQPRVDAGDVASHRDKLESSSVKPHLLRQSLVMSSVGGESLKDVWKLLDESPDTFAPTPTAVAHENASALAVVGSSAASKTRPIVKS